MREIADALVTGGCVSFEELTELLDQQQQQQQDYEMEEETAAVTAATDTAAAATATATAGEGLHALFMLFRDRFGLSYPQCRQLLLLLQRQQQQQQATETPLQQQQSTDKDFKKVADRVHIIS